MISILGLAMVSFSEHRWREGDDDEIAVAVHRLAVDLRSRTELLRLPWRAVHREGPFFFANKAAAACISLRGGARLVLSTT